MTRTTDNNILLLVRRGWNLRSAQEIKWRKNNDLYIHGTNITLVFRKSNNTYIPRTESQSSSYANQDTIRNIHSSSSFNVMAFSFHFLVICLYLSSLHRLSEYNSEHHQSAVMAKCIRWKSYMGFSLFVEWAVHNCMESSTPISPISATVVTTIGSYFCFLIFLFFFAIFYFVCVLSCLYLCIRYLFLLFC